MNFNIKRIIALFIIFFAIVPFAYSQKKHKAISYINKTELHKSDTLAFSLHGFTQYQQDCKDTDNCSYINIIYPVFKSVPKLNRNITNQILNYLNVDNTEDVNLDTAFKKFADDFLAINSDSANTEPVSTLDLYLNIFRQDSRIIVIQHEEDQSGELHPNEEYIYINWDKKLDKEIELKDILVENSETQLTKIAEEIFRKDEKLTPNQSLDNYFFEDGIFKLNDNYQITSKGINFFYNNYEIRPYMEGITDLFIPYTKIKHLLRPGTVVAQYTK